MSVTVIGINHKTAPIAVREAFYFSPDRLSFYLQDILSAGVREAVLLSTCNRSELYCDTASLIQARAWFESHGRLPADQVASMLYTHHDAEAVSHLMSVACGLDSMVLGETQILGQLKEAFTESCSAGASGSLFQRLFQQVFSIAKQVRNSTAIGACPVSVASTAIHLAKKLSPNWSSASILIIGAGETAQLLLRYLSEGFNGKLSIANRSILSARQLLDKLNKKIHVEIYSLHQLALALSQADIIFTATGSAQHLIDADLMHSVQLQQPHSRLIFDLAVPRDVDPQVGICPDVQLYCIDDLKIQIDYHRQGRSHAAEKAREVIMRESLEFVKELTSLEKVTDTIRACRGSIEEMCQQALFKAKQQLHQGVDADIVLNNFAHTLLQKFLHTPSMALKRAGADGRLDLLRFAKQLFTSSEFENREH